ncbi:MAG: ABC transporter substrate-binding protein [Fidelibacterota bacterium]
MKKLIFFIVTVSWILLTAQNEVEPVRFFDTTATPFDTTQPDSAAFRDSLSNIRIGLDTTYLKSIQQVDSLKVMFMEGVNLFNAQKYYDALRVFEKIKSIPAYRNRFLTASEMMITKTYLRLGNFEKTIYTGYEFETRYKNSSYLDDVQYTIGEAYMSEGRYSDALLYYMNVMKQTPDEELLEKCRQSMDIVVDIFLTVEELEALKQSLTNVKFFDFLLSLKIIEKNHQNGNMARLDQNLNRLKWKIDQPFFQEEYNRTIKKIKDRSGGQNYIGVILPLSGDKNYEEIGKEILQGVRASVLRYNQNTDQKISAIVMDNKGEMVTSVKHAKYLGKNPRVLAIFGPVKSENVVAVATFANEKEIPMVSPTATASDITELGEWVFQANVNLKNLGEYLGKYCTTVNNLTTVATIAPLGEYGEKLTDSFSEAVDINGGRIVSQQWYSGKPEQLKIQMMNIREAGVNIAKIKLENKVETLRDSLRYLSLQPGSRWNRDNRFLNVTDSVCQLYEHGAVREMSIQEMLRYTGMMTRDDFRIPRADSLDHKIRSIDGFFIPATTADLKYIVPALKYYNFYANVYGTRNLVNSELLANNRSAARGFYFISDYYIDESSQRYKQLADDYTRITGEKPKRFGIYGFDTMEVLLLAYYNSDITREDVRSKLANMPVYYGLGRNISFTGNQPGSNSCAYIITYKNGRQLPVARVEEGEIVPLD